MVLMMEKAMSSTRGRPKKGEDSRATSLIRAYRDVATMLKWICDVQGVANAQLIDPLIRPAVVDLYARHYETILTLARSRGEADGLPVVLGVTAPLNEYDASVSEYPDAEPPAGQGEPKAEPKKPKAKKPRGEK